MSNIASSRVFAVEHREVWDARALQPPRSTLRVEDRELDEGRPGLTLGSERGREGASDLKALRRSSTTRPGAVAALLADEVGWHERREEDRSGDFQGRDEVRQGVVVR